LARAGSWKAATQRDRGLSFVRACPFHRDDQWRWLRDTAPEQWADAVAFDHAIRSGHQGGVHNAELCALGAYLHRSCRPLDEVDLSTPEDRGQLNLLEIDCQSGGCGL
jgi:hypothetical protein